MPGRMALVAEARDAIEANIWVDALRQAGIHATIHERGLGAAFGGAATFGVSGYAVLVERTAFGAARSVLAGLTDARVLAPLEEAEAEDRRRSRALWMVVGAACVAVAVLAIARLAAS